MSIKDIIIVDDQPSVCREVTAFLKNNYTVHAFTSGRDVLEFLTGNNADLMLLDYDMPGMTGYEVLLNVRLNKSTHKMPVIFLTGVTNDRMRLEMMSRGADDYLTKPIDSGELHRCIEKHIPGMTEAYDA